MKKNFKKVAALSLAGAMVISSFAGCGNSDGDSNKETSESKEETTTAGGTSDSETGSYTDYSNGFTDRVQIDIPVYDRAFEGWDVTDNYYTNWIQENFGEKYNIDVNFVAIGRSTEVTDYTQLLAAGTAPDIIFHYDMPQALAYYDEGAMQALDVEEIEYYAPTYYGNMGETIETYGAVDDETFFFFGERPLAYNFVTLIRQDWIDQVNKEMPNNLDEYNELLTAWKDAGLGNGGGSLVQNNFTYSYAFRDWPVDEVERALYSDLSVADFTWEPTKEYLQNLNYRFNNGLIDTEFYLNTDDASVKADFVSGASGVYSCYLTSNTDVISSLLANDPDAKLSVINPYAGVPEGGVPQGRAYWPFGMIMGINTNTSDEERAAIWMYLEWMSDAENLFFLQNGVEGEDANYVLNDAGLAVPNVDAEGNKLDCESKLSNNNNKDYWCLVVESAQYDDEETNKAANLANWAPAGYEYLIEDNYTYTMDNLEYTTPDALFTTVIESVAEYKSDLNDLWQQLYVKCVMCSEADFESTYNEACEEFLDAGYQEILDEKQAAIDAGNYVLAE